MIVCVFHALGGVVLICSFLGELINHVYNHNFNKSCLKS
jgi:hypothetical protein